MKRKFLLAVIAFTSAVTMLPASGLSPAGEGRGTDGPGQQVVVNNYHYQSGYDYASRIRRFHNTYVTFDFYSPLFTETYWYRYTPYTWGVSIYDDWYYYGAGVSRYTWRSGFGGSYWWGYDPWRDYDPWMGYGWNSWYSPGISYSVNFYLGRPYYHYPMAWNRWQHYSGWNYSRPVNIINHNTYNYYYGSDKRTVNRGGSSGYNPSHPYSSDRRSGYTSIGGRSSETRTTQSSATGTRTVTGTRDYGRTGTAGTRESGNTGNARSDGNKDKSNNGLRMGQYRRGVADPANPDDNGLPRTRNPNVNDRTDPGREQGNINRTETKESRTVTRQVTTTQGTSRGTTQGNTVKQGSRARTTTGSGTPADVSAAETAKPRRQTQNSVKTITRTKETETRRHDKSQTSPGKEAGNSQGSSKNKETSSEVTGSGTDSKKRTATSQRKR
jgi:hypothetical protein